MAFDRDLTTEFVAYIAALKAANITAVDVTTLIKKDEPTVRAAHTEELDDYNTLYMDFLDD